MTGASRLPDVQDGTCAVCSRSIFRRVMPDHLFGQVAGPWWHADDNLVTRHHRAAPATNAPSEEAT